MTLDVATLRQAMVGHLNAEEQRRAALPADRYAALLPGFTAALLAADCTTESRAAMWCAQLGHESLGLRYMQEIWGPTDAQKRYEGRKDLGNTQPGDGRRFAGHGPIQITGRANHAAVSKWAHSRGLVPSPTYFTDRPDDLASDRYGFLGAVWYWTQARPDINALCDRNDVETVTRRINGGMNGLADRRVRWTNCRRLGAQLLPSTEEDPLMALSDSEQRELLSILRELRAQVTGDLDGAGPDGYGWPTARGDLTPVDMLRWLVGQLSYGAAGQRGAGEIPLALYDIQQRLGRLEAVITTKGPAQ